MTFRFLLDELVATASRYGRQYPARATATAAVILLVTARIVWLVFWWLFFAPSALHALEGSITCGGVPVEEGNVALEPVGAPGVASRTAHVTSGSFSIGKVNGVVRDVEYVVRVEGFRKTGKTYPGVKPGEFSEEYEQFVLPAFNRDSENRMKMTRAVLRTGLSLDVQGAPVVEVTRPNRGR